MKIRILRALRGPNYFHNNPVIYMMLDIVKLEYCPSDKVPNFKEKIEKILPSLYNHKCSIGEKGRRRNLWKEN